MSLVFKASSEIQKQNSECLVVSVMAGGKLSQAAQQLDQVCDKTISALIKRGDIKGNIGEALALHHLPGIKAQRVLLIGSDKGKNLSKADFSKWTKTLLEQLTILKVKDAYVAIQELSVADQTAPWLIEQLAIETELNSYQYRSTLSKPKPAPALKKLTLNTAANKAARVAAERGKAVGTGINIARELGNLPGNICTPSYLAKQAKALGRQHPKLTVNIVEEKKMRELGMGALLSVTAGTDQAAKLIVMEYKGAAKTKRPHVLVGKGVTFDSGGISLKPGARMDEMKYDMCGAASVLGTMTTIMQLQPNVNIVAIIGAVENMPSGNATKPGDVVTSMSGQTIEVLNTDAEGRLVLCDALTYAERFKPQSLIDIATLTGACVVALGSHATGLYSNQDDFAEELLTAGESIGDRAWHMPLWDEYQPQLNSNFADMGNIGGPEGGSITAACFLSRFTKKQRWAHMDIAGTAWKSGASKGATGRPVALLSQYLLSKSDKK